MHASSHKVKQRTSLPPFGVKLLLLRALPYPAVRFHPGSKQSHVGRSASQSIALSDQKEQPAALVLQAGLRKFVWTWESKGWLPNIMRDCFT